MTDASNALNTPDDGAEAAMAFLDAQESATKEVVEAEAATEAVEQVEEAQSAVDTVDDPVEDETTAEAALESDETPTKSTFQEYPDDVRSDLEGLSVEAQERLKNHLLMQADYTRKTQELARQREALARREAAADSWDALMSDSEALDLMARAKELKESGDEFDYASAEPEDIDARVNALVERRIAQEKSVPLEQAQRIERWESDLVEPMTEAKLASGLSDEDWGLVTTRLGEQLRAAGIDPVTHITPENAAEFVKPHIGSVRLDKILEAKAEAASKSKADVARSARASSQPPTRTSKMVDPEPWIAEKRDATPAEVRAKTIKEFSDEGVDFSKLGT